MAIMSSTPPPTKEAMLLRAALLPSMSTTAISSFPRPRVVVHVRRRSITAASAVPTHRSTTKILPALEPVVEVLDREPRALELHSGGTKLKIAVVGFGNFGQFLACAFAGQGHDVLAHSRSDHSPAARALGARFFADPHDLCEQHPDVVVLATSILSTEAVLRSLPIHSLRRSTLFVDVLSVKEFPKNLLLQLLPPEFDVLCTHPMFGPESGKNGWAGLPLMYEKVRVADDGEGRRADRCRRFLEIFEREGCRMVEMTCAEHDEVAAEIQFLTHTIGRVLDRMELKSTPINTKGYETLLNLVQNTCSDSFELYNGLFMYNKNSTELIQKLDMAFDSVKEELFERLHGAFRKQLMESSKWKNQQ